MSSLRTEGDDIYRGRLEAGDIYLEAFRKQQLSYQFITARAGHLSRETPPEFDAYACNSGIPSERCTMARPVIRSSLHDGVLEFSEEEEDRLSGIAVVARDSRCLSRASPADSNSRI